MLWICKTKWFSKPNHITSYATMFDQLEIPHKFFQNRYSWLCALNIPNTYSPALPSTYFYTTLSATALLARAVDRAVSSILELQSWAREFHFSQLVLGWFFYKISTRKKTWLLIYFSFNFPSVPNLNSNSNLILKCLFSGDIRFSNLWDQLR